MSKFILRRILQSIPTLFGITIIAYAIMVLAPGNPASELALDPNLTQRQREAMIEATGANDSIPQQYLRWLIGNAPIEVMGITLYAGQEEPVFDRRGNLEEYVQGDEYGILRGDFGKSYTSKKPVTERLGEAIPATLELGVMSLLVGLIVGLPIGVLAAVGRGGWFDQVTRVGAVFISAVPVFWLGLILLLIFGSTLQWLPMGNRFPLSFSGEYSIGDRIRHLILPTITLASFTVATYSRFMRASLLDVLGQDYVRTARSKGISDRRVWFVHAMRNAMIPIATLLGPSLVGVMSGAVLTETIYSWPGMGLLVVGAVRTLDYNVVMAVVLLFSVLTVIGYLVSDMLYAVFDPRIRLG